MPKTQWAPTHHSWIHLYEGSVADGERLPNLRAVVDLASTVMYDNAARLWMRTPNRDLDYQVPRNLIAAGQCERVIGLLRAPAEGITT